MVGKQGEEQMDMLGCPSCPGGASKGPTGSSRLEHISEFPPQGVKPDITCQSVLDAGHPGGCDLKFGGRHVV